MKKQWQPKIINYFKSKGNNLSKSNSRINKRQYNITDFFTKKSYEAINRCITCGIDMGECNPRQYCGKSYCHNEIFLY